MELRLYEQGRQITAVQLREQRSIKASPRPCPALPGPEQGDLVSLSFLTEGTWENEFSGQEVLRQEE